MAGLYCAPGMRCEGNQSNQSNQSSRRPPQPHQRPWQEERDNLIQEWGRDRGKGREGGRGHVTATFLNKHVQKKTRKREHDFGRTFLKLCWVMIGWLPPLPFPVTNTDSRYTSLSCTTIFTLTDCRSTGVLSDSAVEPNKEDTRRRLEGVSHYSRWTHSRKRKWCHERFNSPALFPVNVSEVGGCIKWQWHLQLQLCPVTSSAAFTVRISWQNKTFVMKTKNLASILSLAWI